MAEATKNSGIPAPRFEGARVAVVMPLFPRMPGLRDSLKSLAAQTRPPARIVLLDDGSHPGTETLPGEFPELPVELFPVEPGPLASAINAVLEHCAPDDYLTFLQAGDRYAPQRIEKCLAAFETPEGNRPPGLVVTKLRAIDSRGQALPADDPRTAHLARLWAPGQGGAELPDWLGCGYFPGPFSNLFVRRDYLAANPWPENTLSFDQAVVLIAALQGQMIVWPEALLDHYPPAPPREATPRQTAENLQLQLSVLTALSGRLAVSPETRRNTAAYHRTAWNSLTGAREDLFQQIILQLAAAASPEDTQAVLTSTLRSHEAQNAPAHWAALLEGHDPLDLAGYADALRRTREKLDETREEKERLGQVAEAAQDSGWVRFGAWIGDRSARRIMELEQKDEAPDPLPSPSEPEVKNETGPGV
jgi:Glycosyltransferases involved in cell wall biogenesis